jgi:FKBP-type peptidyl-prolyl cis-trans isomerase
MKSRLLLFISLGVFFGACGTEKGGDGTKKLAVSGYDYVMHIEQGGVVPQDGEYAYFHAQTRNNDKVVNASRIDGGGNTPFLKISKANLTSEERVSPVQEILQIMSIGDSATIFLPIDTLTEDQKPIGFKGTDFMLYDLVLIDIKTSREFHEKSTQLKNENEAIVNETQARAPAIKALIANDLKQYKEGVLKNDLVVTDSGLKVFFHEKTTGKMPPPGGFVSVNYAGVLMNGSMFDNSFDRGEPISFALGKGQVIAGWDEGIALLPEGSKATFFIPYNLAYGEAGGRGIPERADLVFYVELVKAN